MSIGDDPVLDPQAVLRSFPTSFRGYDADQVDTHLRAIAAALRSRSTVVESGSTDLAAARAEIDRLSAKIEILQDELAAARTDAEAAAVVSSAPSEPFDEARAMQLLGEETTKVLQAARSSAATIVAKAEAEARERTDAVDQLQSRVDREMAELRKATDTELAEARASSERELAEARAAVEAEIEQRNGTSLRVAEERVAQAAEEAAKLVADAQASAVTLAEGAQTAARVARTDADELVAAATAEASGIRADAEADAASARAEVIGSGLPVTGAAPARIASFAFAMLALGAACIGIAAPRRRRRPPDRMV